MNLAELLGLPVIPIWILLLGSVLSNFGEAFVKCFQSRNIAQGREFAAGLTSMAVTLTFAANLSFLVLAGLPALLTAMVGGSAGTVLSIRLHKRMFKCQSKA